MSGRAWWNLEPCGTVAAFKRHKRRGEPVDDACRLAWNVDNRFRMRAWRARRAGQDGGQRAA